MAWAWRVHRSYSGPVHAPEALLHGRGGQLVGEALFLLFALGWHGRVRGLDLADCVFFGLFAGVGGWLGGGGRLGIRGGFINPIASPLLIFVLFRLWSWARRSAAGAPASRRGGRLATSAAAGAKGDWLTTPVGRSEAEVG